MGGRGGGGGCVDPTRAAAGAESPAPDTGSARGACTGIMMARGLQLAVLASVSHGAGTVFEVDGDRKQWALRQQRRGGSHGAAASSSMPRARQRRDSGPC